MQEGYWFTQLITDEASLLLRLNSQSLTLQFPELNQILLTGGSHQMPPYFGTLPVCAKQIGHNSWKPKGDYLNKFENFLLHTLDNN